MHYIFIIISLLFSFIQPSHAESQSINNLEGTFEIRSQLNLDQSEVIQYLVKTDNHAYYYLDFLSPMSKIPATGSRVRIKQAEFTNEHGNYHLRLYANDMQIIKSVLTAIPDAFGPQKTAAILVNFTSSPTTMPFTAAQINSIVFTGVNNMFNEFSYKQTTVIGDVFGYFTLPIDGQGDCNTMLNQIPAAAATAATAAGVDLSTYKRLVYIFPTNFSCGFAGIATIGGTVSQAWINGYLQQYVWTHEMGHNLGLYHSNRLQCTTSPIEGNCTTVGYGDTADTMAAGPVSHFNAFQKERLGWLNYKVSPRITTVTSSDVYVIDPYETANTKPKALKILKQNLLDGSQDYYYVEFRQGIGYDLPLEQCGTNCDFTKGVILHTGNNNNPNTSLLLDMTPLDNNPNFVSLTPGKTFTDVNAANGGVKITVNSVSFAGAIVTVIINNQPIPCTHKTPIFTITPTTVQNVTAGNSANYTVSLRNTDSSTCPANIYQLTAATSDSTISASFNRSALAIKPGQTAPAVLTLKAAANAAVGSYTGIVKETNLTSGGTPLTVTANLAVVQ